MKRDNLHKLSTVGRSSRLPLRRVYFFVAFLLFIVILLIGFRFSGAYNDLQNKSEWALSLNAASSQEKGINYLLYGFYEEDGELYLEDIFLLNYPPQTDFPHIIFIPGEMLLNRQTEYQNATRARAQENDEENNEGTNESLATFFFPTHFYNEGGAKLLIEQISNFLGVPIHYYLELDYSGVPEMVDYRGGITYRGYALSGEEYYDYFLEGYMDEEPLQRALRRMQALVNLVEFVGEKKGIFNKSRSVRRAAPYIDTNMSRNGLEEFIPSFIPSITENERDVYELPGMWREQIDGEYYFEPDRELISYMMANLGEEFILPRELIRVAVLNGSGVAGVAAEVAAILEAEGFKVVEVDNADSFDYPRTQVIARQEEMKPAREVAYFIPDAELLKEVVEGSTVMVTVVVGKNFTLD